MPRILFKSLPPKQLQVTRYSKEILDQLRAEGKEIKTLYQNSSSTWKPKPKFRTDFRAKGLDASIKISTRDVRYVNLDRGVKNRWAVMSADYRPKSKVRSLTASAGRGKVVIRGHQAMQARGIKPLKIKAREFSKEIVKRRRPFFIKNMRSAMKRAARKSF